MELVTTFTNTQSSKAHVLSSKGGQDYGKGEANAPLKLPLPPSINEALAFKLFNCYWLKDLSTTNSIYRGRL